MKEDIEQFKKENGNIQYSVKELLYGMHTKMDKFNDRIELIEKEKLDKSLFWKIIGGLSAIFTFIIGLMAGGRI